MLHARSMKNTKEWNEAPGFSDVKYLILFPFGLRSLVVTYDRARLQPTPVTNLPFTLIVAIRLCCEEFDLSFLP